MTSSWFWRPRFVGDWRAFLAAEIMMSLSAALLTKLSWFTCINWELSHYARGRFDLFTRSQSDWTGNFRFGSFLTVVFSRIFWNDTRKELLELRRDAYIVKQIVISVFCNCCKRLSRNLNWITGRNSRSFADIGWIPCSILNHAKISSNYSNSSFIISTYLINVFDVCVNCQVVWETFGRETFCHCYTTVCPSYLEKLSFWSRSSSSSGV